MQLIRIRYLSLFILLILTTACRAGSPSDADGPSTLLRTGPTPTPVPSEAGVEQLTYTVQRGTVARKLEFTARVAPSTSPHALYALSPSLPYGARHGLACAHHMIGWGSSRADHLVSIGLLVVLSMRTWLDIRGPCRLVTSYCARTQIRQPGRVLLALSETTAWRLTLSTSHLVW